jgi:hypothetical protein
LFPYVEFKKNKFSPDMPLVDEHPIK